VTKDEGKRMMKHGDVNTIDDLEDICDIDILLEMAEISDKTSPH